ncbi:MAG: ferrous iron transport protein B [Coriobacteriia bacterium]|nr:ferrous iron transport protein B [Coriobacteriia bacterium]
MLLSELKNGQHAVIRKVSGEGAIRRHLLDMGLTPNAFLVLQKRAPMGDPIQVNVRGFELTLRLEEAGQVEVALADGADAAAAPALGPSIAFRQDVEHPGLGELSGTGDYKRHVSRESAKKGPLTFALVGNQNCGKTTLFNQLTGSKQHVGNFPGVTVDRKDGIIRNHADALVTDLPGVYSLSPYSNEEIVTRDFLLDSKPDGIINIVDGTNIERNLYLTMQIMELGIPMVLALNMMDEVESNGGTIHVNALEQALGIPVVPISAVRNEGVEELVDHALHVARFCEVPGQIDFCPSSEQEDDPLGAVHRCIHATAHVIEPYAEQAGIPVRFAATKVVEGDEIIAAKLNFPRSVADSIKELIAVMERDAGMDSEAALANMRFSYLSTLCGQTVVRPQESREHKRSVAVDKILTGRFTGIPCFFAIMAAVFVLTFGPVGGTLSDLVSAGVDIALESLDAGLAAWGMNPVAASLFVDGIGAGVGAVIGFLPTIATLFFFLSILEDSGYMARVAFVMDRAMRKIGLSGRSIVPLLMGFGCSVPSIMATRTLSSERDRKMTTMLVPFMSCSAKLPIYSLLVAAFFPRELQPIVMIGLYAFGVLVGIAFAAVLKKLRLRGKPVPFVMELPNYRLPAPKSVGRLVWDKSKGFIKKAFTVVLAACVIIWFLQTFDVRLNVVDDVDSSLLAMIGGVIAPLFAPLGYGDWRCATALMTGFMAKESVVSTLTQVMGPGVDLTMLFTPTSAVAFLVFVLLYTPCVAAIATVRSEQGGARAAVEMVLLQCSVAWVVSYFTYAICSIVSGQLSQLMPAGLIAAVILCLLIAAYLRSQQGETASRSVRASCPGCSGCESDGCH